MSIVTRASQQYNKLYQRVVAAKYGVKYGCVGGAAVQRRTRDRKVAGSTPGRGAIKSTRSTQPSILPG